MKLKHLLKHMDNTEEIFLCYNADYFEDDCESEYLQVKDIQYKYLDRKVAHVGAFIQDGESYVLIALNDE